MNGITLGIATVRRVVTCTRHPHFGAGFGQCPSPFDPLSRTQSVLPSAICHRFHAAWIVMCRAVHISADGIAFHGRGGIGIEQGL